MRRIDLAQETSRRPAIDRQCVAVCARKDRLLTDRRQCYISEFSRRPPVHRERWNAARGEDLPEVVAAPDGRRQRLSRAEGVQDDVSARNALQNMRAAGEA